MIYRLLLLLALIPAAAAAQNEAATVARAAAAELEAASQQLDAAEGARDRVKALTQTIQAFEKGLGAMRAGLRQAAINEAQLTKKLQSREAEVGQLFGALQSIGGNPSPVSLLHPDGPLGTARAGMLLAELTPALNAQADGLRRDLEQIQTLRTLQNDAASRLQEGLSEIQNARTALNQAMAERTDLPTRFTEDPVRTAILIASTETLEGFASGLAEMASDAIEPAPINLDGQVGSLPLPAQGLVLRRAGEADAAGVARAGMVLATRARAIVTSPTAATIRYTGPLLDLGNVVILEPQADTLFVFAGLDVVYGTAGQVIAGGTPIGLMGAGPDANNATSSPNREGTGTDRSETLYIEVRQDNTPQDPMDWFRTDKDG
ncbi:Septal ring factor EnvC, activator of murein hydrolases AmiA and AmiB [Sulfitobacter brevis]|uniref:Septal ring factor EnvC, activator of murein hydrolases AmiA and AmiB n=1 Tax=Sulfitobacter brevis TaxID=74348 RepID=A0A1I1VVM6_9RHOB|nr:peptidoglycan DD-metalloendopeptidase family protein [Sulfitobacter brevis]SFD86799.1 Septal ring factor EnvC, activator of murein hydrolases AmiA and AmiB [Sulfitobacter brevis]